jgi:RNA-directed DNA polymerase
MKSEKAANRVMKSVTTYLEKSLGLKINITKSKTTSKTSREAKAET